MRHIPSPPLREGEGAVPSGCPDYLHLMRLPFPLILGSSPRIFLGSVLCASLLMSGCAVPGYPYNGQVPQGAMTQGAMTQGAPPSPIMAGGAPGTPSPYPYPYANAYPNSYPYAYTSVPAYAYAPPIYPSPFPYIYAPAPQLIAPSFYSGCGNGYWYGNRFWPYRSGCAFYGGRYYGGYRANYWHGGNGNWQGGAYRGGNWQGGNYHGGGWNH